MSDFRDPRDPMAGSYSVDSPEVRRMRADGSTGGWALGPLIGLLLLAAVIFFAASSGENTQVAQNETPLPAATEPANPQMPAPPRSPAEPSGN